MAIPSYRLIGVGAFVVGGLVLFGVGLFMIGDRRMLFAEHFEVFSTFDSVTGLDVGATVRVAGLDAGEVLEIQIPVQPQAQFRVRMRVREDVHTLVRTDSVASIQTEGLIGTRFVQIERGSDQAPPVPDGGTIGGREPFDFTDLLQQASDAVQNVNAMVTEIGENLKETIAVTTQTVNDVDDLVDEIEEEVTVIARSGRQIAEDMAAILQDVRAGRGTLGKLVYDDELYDRATQIATNVEETVQSIREAVGETRSALDDLRSKELPGAGLVADLRQTLNAAREAMADLADATEALKHNWFLRGFFRDRGYFDLNALSVDEYRGGALEQGNRQALRIWIDAQYLFAPEPDGALRLTDEGQARVDSAMSEFLRYARETLIIVEGYSEEATRDQRFLTSRQRAAEVREYLLSRFQLDPSRVAVMPMGLEAPDSPRGDDRWSGVALAAFVQRTGNR